MSVPWMIQPDDASPPEPDGPLERLLAADYQIKAKLAEYPELEERYRGPLKVLLAEIAAAAKGKL